MRTQKTKINLFFSEGQKTSWQSAKALRRSSDQRIVIFPANGNSNRFGEQTSVQIGIKIVCESQNLRIGIGTIFVRWEVFANYSQIPEIFFSHIFLIFFFLDSLSSFEKLTGQRKP